MQEQQLNREAIVADYLTGDYTFRQLGLKHGIDFRTIHYWVSKYKGKIKVVKKKAATVCDEPILPVDVKQLQTELRKAKLHAEVLEEMLKLSENLTGIELRKKFGTKRS